MGDRGEAVRSIWSTMSIFRRLLVGIGGPLIAGLVVLLATVSMRLDVLGEREASQSRATLKQRVATELADKVDVAYAVLVACHAETTAAGRSLAESQATCADRLRRARFGVRERSYFWLHSFDRLDPSSPRMIMHPTLPALDGKDVSDFVDRRRFQRIAYRGKVYPADAPEVRDIPATNLFVDMNRAVARDGRGVVEYYWPDPERDMTVGYAKMSAVRLFEPWGWVVGTGEYYDQIDLAVGVQAAAFEAEKVATTRRLELVAVVIFGAILGAVMMAGKLLRDVVAAATGELARLAKAVEAGRLQERGAVERVHPEFQPIIRGANAIVDRFTGPLSVISDYLARLARGEVPPRL
jgi:methyl-accepting chemotaxis protein